MDLASLELAEPIFKNVKFYVSGEVSPLVIELLKKGGAERMNYFGDYVTHMLCGEDTEDTDLSDANEVYEVPAVTVKWVIMCAKLNRLVNTKPYLYKTNRLFENSVFCLSKLNGDLNAIWAMITYYGGVVQLNFDNSCSHLVTTNTNTAKYAKATSLGVEKITIITPDWIVECIRNNCLIQSDLFHPKRIQWPKVLKHESTTSITGFEPPEQDSVEETLPETSTPDSTQALLDKLKQRMPWNQPQTSTNADNIVPPNVVAPSYTQNNKLPQMEQMRTFNQQQQQLNVASQQQQQQQTLASSAAFQQTAPNVVISNQQLPRSVVHHTAQPQQQQQFVQQQQQQQNIFQQLNQQQQGQLTLNRLISQQQQQQQRPNLQTSMAQQLNKLNQQSQFAQQLLQRNQLNQLQNQQVPNQVIQQQQQQQQTSVAQQQNLIQRTAALGQLNKLQMPHAQVIQHIQQIGNRQQIANHLIQNQQQQQQMVQQLNQNQQLLQQQNQVLTQQQQLSQNQVIVQQQNQQLLSQNQQLLQQKQQLLQNQQLLQQQQQQFGNVIQQPVEQQQLNQNQATQQQQQQQIGLIQNKIVTQNQFPQQQQQQQQTVAGIQIQQQQQQQFVSSPQQQQFVQNQHFVQQQQQQQTQQQFSQPQQLLQQQQQQQQPQQLTQQPQLLAHQQMLINQQQTQQQQQNLQFNQQQTQPNQQQRPINQHLWQQQQQQGQQQPSIGIRHPAAIVQQSAQGPRVQWSPNQQQRQFIQLDAQTHQQLQQMAPEQRAAFVAKLQKQRQLLLQRQQIQMQQQRGGHILIRGAVPPGLNAQQQMQWLQQQAKQQGVVLPTNIQQTAIAPPPPQPPPTQEPQQHAAPGLSPIQQQQQQQTPPLFAAAEQQKRQQQLQLQQQQYRLQQLQLQREQAQKNAAAVAAAVAQQQQGGLVAAVAAPQTVVPQQGPPGVVQAQPQQGNVVVRPIGQPQPVEVAAVVEQNVQQQHPLVVNPKTKTALANMLSIRLQTGGATMGPGSETIGEPSAAGTLRLMTAQHNAALNSAARPQDLLALQQQQQQQQQQQRRQLSTPAPPDLVRPPSTPVVPQSPQGEPPKLQYSPRAAVPLQHRPGTFYGHNPNLKLPPDLFLLGCIFVVVEVEKYLEETIPGWQQKIEKHGGEIEPQYCNRVTHVLCETQRHGVVMQALRDYKRCVTLYWLSDVIQRRQVLPPWTALHLPTMYLDTTPAAKHLIALSGFSGNERNRVKHMIKYTGAAFTSYFSKHNTLLICGKLDGPKYMHAKKWGIPVVNVQWLTDVMLGNFSALNQMEHVKFQQFNTPPNFSFDPILVPNLMQAWKMPINISQESYERVKRSSSPVLMPKKTKKLKTEHIDENENEVYVPSTHHRILFSMCFDGEEMKKIVKQLGGALATDANDCTHLIMPYLARTNKLLFAICRGIHILPETWLRDSQMANKFLDEINYTFDAKEFNCQYKCDFYQTLNTKNRNRLFEGRSFFVTPSVVPSKSIVIDLIQSCGGVVERIRRTSAQIEATNFNAPYSYLIVTHENDLHLVADLFKNKKEKVRIVCSVELIFSAILKQTFEVEPFTVKIL